jgi:hypothetical protein
MRSFNGANACIDSGINLNLHRKHPLRAGCPGASPAIAASHRGSQLFVYHANAVEDFRSQVLAPWFVSYAASKGQTLDQVGGKAR